MVDTKNQYLAIQSAVDQAIQEVLDSAAYINGKAVKDFAQNLATYLGSDYVIPCANGTDALQIAMMALGLEPGDEVITPSFTYIATTEVVALLKLTPVFVEVDPITFCMDIESLKKATLVEIEVGSKMYGLSHDDSDKDLLCIYATSETEKNSFCLTHHQIQYKDEINRIDYIFVNIHNFLRNSLNGDSTINFEVKIN